MIPDPALGRGLKNAGQVAAAARIHPPDQEVPYDVGAAEKREQTTGGELSLLISCPQGGKPSWIICEDSVRPQGPFQQEGLGRRHRGVADFEDLGGGHDTTR